jgi:putative MATE family efflux protein
MTTNLVSSVVNVICNYALIGGHFGFPALGVTGAAIATVLGTVVAFFMSLRSLFKKDSYVRIPLMISERIRPTMRTFKSLVKLSSTMLLENLAMRIGFLTTAMMGARLGTDAFAALNVGMNFMTLGFAFADGMQVSAVALTGESLGAGLKAKAKEYGSICQHIGLGISLTLAAIEFFFGRALFGLFFDEPHILDMGVLIMRFIMFIVILQISQVIYGGCLRAAGDVKYTLIASLVSVTLIRSLCTYILVGVLGLGLAGVWIGILADQTSRFLFMSTRFRQGKWLEMKI